MKHIAFAIVCALLAYSCSKEIDPPAEPVLVDPGTTTLQVKSDLQIADSFKIRYDGKWSIAVNPSNPSWLNISLLSGTGPATIFVKATELNTGNTKRTALLTITADDVPSLSSTLEVTQDPYTFSEWSKLYGGSDEEFFQDVIKTPDGGYIAVGATLSADGDVTANHGGYDVWVIKTDAAGNLLWQKSYGGSGNEIPKGIFRTSGGYIVYAASASPEIFSSNSETSGHPWLIKLDENGNIIWDESVNIDNIELLSVSELSSGGFICSGVKSSDGLLFKLDAQGALQWQKTYGGLEFERLSTVLVAADGGFIAMGNKNNAMPGDPVTPEKVNIWLIKTDADGNLLWEKQYGGNNMDLDSKMIATKDGGYLMTGMTQSTDIAGYHGELDLYVAKLDGEGNLIWQKALGGTSGEGLSWVVETADSDFIITTNTGSTDGDVTEHQSTIWIVKVNASGEIVWNRSFGEGYNGVNAIISLGDNKYMLAGSDEDEPGNYDALLFTLNDL